MRKYFFLLSFVILLIFPNVYAEELIPITQSFDMENVVFDGKWTNPIEWKRTSLETISLDDQLLSKIRIGHQGDYIFVMLDMIGDKTLDHISDRAMICIDGNNDHSKVSMNDDYCFMASLNGKKSFVYQGGSNFPSKNYFQQIPNPDGFVGVGGISDHNDIYSKEKHTSFEFKIPIETIGRNHIYGFLIYYYDSNTNESYTWPSNIPLENNLIIPSPEFWGEIYSPDKSLPEFNLPIIVFAVMIFVIILAQSKAKIRILRS